MKALQTTRLMRAALFCLGLSFSACKTVGGNPVKNSDEPVKSSREKGMEPLFTAVLQYRSESKPDSAIGADETEGAFIGSGDGTVTGDQIHGTIRWSLWAGNCVYPLLRKGQSIPEGLHLCTMNPRGLIETPDGTRVRFDGRGYGLRTNEKYNVGLTMVFATEDTRYSWLTKVLGVMEGEFDEKAGRSVWNVFVPASSEKYFQLPKNTSAIKENERMNDAHIDQLREAFNASSNQVRLVSVLSPTCSMCQKGHGAIKTIFSDFKSDKLKGLLVWLPMLKKDDSHMASAQSGEFQDPRIIFQGWDKGKEIAAQFSNTLRLKQTAWDIYLVYKPGVKWTDVNPPVPTFWMHQLRGEDVDSKQCLNVDRLKSEIKALL